MKTRFKQLNVQGKLLAVFGIITLIGALTMGVNILGITVLGSGSSTLFELVNKLEAIYEAQNSIQGMELATVGYLSSQNPIWFDEFEHHSTQLDEFIRESLLAAESPSEKAALYELERINQVREETFSGMVNAINADDWDTLYEMQGPAEEDLRAMYAQIDSLSGEIVQVLDEIDSQKVFFEIVAAIISSIALVTFLGLAVMAAVLISQQVNRPVALLSQAVTAVETDQFEPRTLDELGDRTDEIGQLTQAFVHMAKEVKEREEDLKQQAEAIRTRIEQSQRN